MVVEPIASSGNGDDDIKKLKNTRYNATLPTHETNNNMIIIINNNSIRGGIRRAAAAVINGDDVVVGAPVRLRVRLLLVLTTASRPVPGNSRLDSRTRLFSYSAVSGGSRRREFRSDRRQK